MGTIIATITTEKAVNKVEWRMTFYLPLPSAIERCDLTVRSDSTKLMKTTAHMLSDAAAIHKAPSNYFIHRVMGS